jgi:hypothetical protein
MIDRQDPRASDGLVVFGRSNAEMGKKREKRSFHSGDGTFDGVFAQVNVGQPHMRGMIKVSGPELQRLEGTSKLIVVKRYAMFHSMTSTGVIHNSV